MATEPRTEKARATRERIVRAATQLVSRKGYFHTTVDDVLAATRLTKGGFYAHFTSKEDLGRAVIDHATQVFFDRVLAHVHRFADPRDQLHALLEAYRMYAIGRAFDGGCIFVNLATEMDDQHEEFAATIAERFGDFRAVVRGIVEQGQSRGAFRAEAPADGLAVAFVAYLTGTMMQAKVARAFELFDAGNAVMHGLVDRWALPKESA
ncbi:MAG: TetR/AcrR family transcriptional regulator [Deltaproteobacteria bacterium]|nr:TetR/AcrR family transcriptional regulator [Deltaproteobacteria bacterium]